MDGDGARPPVTGGNRSVPSAARRAWGFGAAVVLVLCGALLQLSDLPGATTTAMGGGGMPSEPMGPTAMSGGMLLTAAGLALGAAALVRGTPRTAVDAGDSPDFVEATRFRQAHLVTLCALAVVLVEANMRPLALGFVLPGMGGEYQLSLATVSMLPVVGLTGTVLGSVTWPVVADRYGRRPGLLLSTLLVTATSSCGGMPTFAGNLAMCFLMGVGVGGMLPLVFTLVAEVVPRRARGWVAVLLGGVGGIGGYLAAGTAAYLLEPAFGWRSLWASGLVTGLAVLAVLPLVPESPLYLLRNGRPTEARAVLDRFGAHVRGLDAAVALPPVTPATSTGASPAACSAAGPVPIGIRSLLQRTPKVTIGIGSVGMVWGLVNFGFLVMLPDHLRASGMSGAAASGLLARAALYAVPALVVVVVLYALWSGRRILVVTQATCAVALGAIAAWDLGDLGRSQLVAAVGLLVLAHSATNAALLPYCAEVYPTAFRATGTSLAAAATKLGGVAGPQLMVGMAVLADGLVLPALFLAGLVAVTTLLVARRG